MKVKKTVANITAELITDGKHIITRFNSNGSSLCEAMYVLNALRENAIYRDAAEAPRDSWEAAHIVAMEMMMESDKCEELEVPDDFFNKKEEV